MIVTKLTVGFTWAKDDRDVAHYSFGSVHGAKKWVQKNKEQINWYAIEEVEYIPCDKDDPMGQLYLGMLYHEFKDFREDREDGTL
jgi:hypothetical protein